MKFSKFITAALAALLSTTALAANDPPATPRFNPGLTGSGGLKQKTCSTVDARVVGDKRILNIWNTDGSTAQFVNAAWVAPGLDETLIMSVCSNRSPLPDAHKYWASITRVPVSGPPTPTGGAPMGPPMMSAIVVTYPPSDTLPLFKPQPKGLWTTGMQQKTCAYIEWAYFDKRTTGMSGASYYVHNTDGSFVEVVGIPYVNKGKTDAFGELFGPIAPSPEQLAVINACGTDATVDGARTYRVSVDNPSAIIPKATRILYQLAQP